MYKSLIYKKKKNVIIYIVQAGYNDHKPKKSTLDTAPSVKFQRNGRIKKSPESFHLLSANDFPTSFDARKKWSSRRDDSCPTIRKVLNNGRCKCGWVYILQLLHTY